MKTIITSLPVYDKLIKQTYYRAKANEKGLMATIKTPPWRLPAMQWNVENDDPGIITGVNLIGLSEGNISTPAICTYWVNGGGAFDYETFTSEGLDVTSAINAGGGQGLCQTVPNINLNAGDTIKVTGNFILNSGTAPTLRITDGITNYDHTLSQATTEYEDTITDTGIYYIQILTAVATNFSFTGVEVEVDSFTSYFVNLPELITGLTNEYFQYNEESLNFLMPYGIYYLKFTTANGFEYYSELFEVVCIYDNLIYQFTNSGTVPYLYYIVHDTTISYVFSNNATGSLMYSNSFLVNLGETININFNYIANAGAGGDGPFYIELRDSTNHTTVVSNTVTLAVGLNQIELVSTFYGNAEVVVRAPDTTTSVMYGSEMFVYRDYSDKYLKIDFSNTCDIGDILYQNGFTQTLWIESEPMEATFPIDDKGVEDGEGRFIRTFARQVKKYSVKTLELPDFMVDVFHRMRMHDDVELTDLVGDTNEVYNLEVEHEWLWDDKYYAQITLTFDFNEVFVVAGCCNNIT